MARILVTGGSGRLGAYVARELDRAGEIEILDLAPPSSSLRHHAIDLLDFEGLTRVVEGCDAIVHLAGRDLFRGGTAEQFGQANLFGTWNLMQAARKAGVRRVVQCSSTATYGFLDGDGIMPDRLPIDESHPLRPANPYGQSKLMAELACQALAARGGPDVVSLRVAMVAFPDLAVEMWQAAATREPGRLFAYVKPEDAARAVRLALEAETRGWLAINIAAPDTYADEPTLDIVQRLYGGLPEEIDDARFERDPKASPFDMTLARTALGFSIERRWGS